MQVTGHSKDVHLPTLAGASLQLRQAGCKRDTRHASMFTGSGLCRATCSPEVVSIRGLSQELILQGLIHDRVRVHLQHVGCSLAVNQSPAIPISL